MSRKSIATGLFGAALFFGFGLSTATAETIDYTLTGSAQYQVQGGNGAGTFTFSWTGDTTNVEPGTESRIFDLPGTVNFTPISGTPYNGNFQSLTQLVLDSTDGIAFGFQDVGEPQGNPSNVQAVFQLTDPALTSIALDKDFSVTTSNASLSFAMPLINGGSFSGFAQIINLTSPVTFSADISAAPIPASFTLFAMGVGVMFLYGWLRKRRHAASFAAA
jgi:hypothetical protein